MERLEDLEAESGSPDGALARIAVATAQMALAAGDLRGALGHFDAALAQSPDDIQSLAGRAAVLRRLGRGREALRDYLSALRAYPNNIGIRLDMAATLRDLGLTEEARTIFSLLVRHLPDSPEVWHALGLEQARDGAPEVADACFRRALALEPARLETLLARGAFAARQLNHEAAAAAYQQAQTVAPDDADAHVGLALALLALGRLDEADGQIARALELDDRHVGAHLARARLRLLTGRLPEAWKDIGWRWRRPGAARPATPGAIWTGEPLDGKTILAWSESGLSDTLQLCRYLPLLAQQGARVLLATHDSLVPLMRGLAGVDQVVAFGQPFPPQAAPDFNAALLDLPAIFATTGETIPSPPAYLSPPPDRPAFDTPAGVVLKVGLCWAGGANDAERRLHLSDMLPLAEVDGVILFSLQLPPYAAEVEQTAHPGLISDLSPTIGDFLDMAARIAELDMVIAMDSPVCHLAGAMGKPVWTLLPNAPDARWMLEREETPWYASMRLFRQGQAESWTQVIGRVRGALETLATQRRQDERIRRAAGPQPAEATMLREHLAAGDLLLDVGAGSGLISKAALDHPAGDIYVLAFEPDPAAAARLRESATGGIEVLELAAAAAPGHAVVSPLPRRGRRVFPVPAWSGGRPVLVALDTVLRGLPHINTRRMVLRIAPDMDPAAVLAGLEEQLKHRGFAAVVFRHTGAVTAARLLQGAGYRLLRFPPGRVAGALVPFDGKPGTVLALPRGSDPAALYGDQPPPGSPEATRRAVIEARTLAAQAVEQQRGGQVNSAANLYARALALDPFSPEANANLGVLLRQIGRTAAAIACLRRALVRGSGAAALTTLGNALRECGRLDEAEAAQQAALAMAPDSAQLLMNLYLLRRDQGRHAEALELVRKAAAAEPNAPLIRWELAQCHMRLGQFARGFALFESRRRPLRSYAQGAVPWDGRELAAHDVLIHDETEAADTLLLARFLPLVGQRGGMVTLECDADLARLLSGVPGIEDVVPRGAPLEYDLYAPLPDLPRLLATDDATLSRDIPYLQLPDDMEPHPFPRDGRLRVGISWQGRLVPRPCPLAHYLSLIACPDVHLVSLQRGEAVAQLQACGALPFVEELGSACEDMAEVALIVEAVDVVITGDTAEAQLAGAMGKPVWVLLPTGSDWRWPANREDSPWYPTMRVFHQSADGSWTKAFSRIADLLAAMGAAKRARA